MAVDNFCVAVLKSMLPMKTGERMSESLPIRLVCLEKEMVAEKEKIGSEPEKTEMPPVLITGGQKIRQTIYAVAFNIVNLVMFLAIIPQVKVVRGDGPSGMLEFLMKGILGLLAFAYIIFGLLLTLFAFYRTYKSRNNKSFWKVATTLVSLPMLLILIIFLSDACSDDTGYCRKGKWDMQRAVSDIRQGRFGE